MKLWMKKSKHLLHRHPHNPRHAVITARNFESLNEDRLKEWLEDETCGKVKQIVHVTNEQKVYPEWHVLVVKACEIAPVSYCIFAALAKSLIDLLLPDSRPTEEAAIHGPGDWSHHSGLGRRA